MADEKKKQTAPLECSWEEISQPGAYISREQGNCFASPRKLWHPGIHR